jgi:hypothetical protein
MEWVIGICIAVVVIGLGALAQRKGWIDVTGKHAGGRGGGVAGLVGGVDEVFAPMKYEASKELERQTELPAPAPVPGDGDKDIFKGRVRINLDE